MLLSGEPTLIVSTVYCIYSLGNPQEWKESSILVGTGDEVNRTDSLRKLVEAR